MPKADNTSTPDRRKSKERNAWVQMRMRCQNPNTKRYDRYGGRGIKVCERWEIFENFASDMGPHPGKGYSLERIDNDGNYEPSNCKWATQKEQCRNRSSNRTVFYKGVLMILDDALKLAGIKAGTFYDRLALGWTEERALMQPIRDKNRMVTFEGVAMTLPEALALAGLKKHTFYDRLRIGWSVDRALSEPVGHPSPSLRRPKLREPS